MSIRDMTDPARKLAQQDPVANLSARWGELTVRARNRVAALEDALRELQTVTDQLAERNLVVATDLGPTGNAARSAFQAAVADSSTHGFSLPGAA